MDDIPGEVLLNNFEENESSSFGILTEPFINSNSKTSVGILNPDNEEIIFFNHYHFKIQYRAMSLGKNDNKNEDIIPFTIIHINVTPTSRDYAKCIPHDIPSIEKNLLQNHFNLFIKNDDDLYSLLVNNDTGIITVSPECQNEIPSVVISSSTSRPVLMSYSVEWVETNNIAWKERWKTYIYPSTVGHSTSFFSVISLKAPSSDFKIRFYISVVLLFIGVPLTVGFGMCFC